MTTIRPDSHGLPGLRPAAIVAACFSLVVFGFAEPAMACPNCRDSLAAAGRAIGYAVSILGMMSAPFLIAGFWAVKIIRLRR